MNIEEIDKWLDNEYGVSYTRLEELHDFVVEQDLKHREEKNKEINRLNNIINELEEFLNKVVETGASIEQITCKNILNYLQELKENKC